MKNTLRLGLLLLLGSLSSCAATSKSYVDALSGYSIVRGRITKVLNLSGEVTQTLSDGMVVTVTDPGCTLSMKFPDDQTKTLDVAPGMMVVYGFTDDFLLRSEFAKFVPAPGKSK